MPFALGATALTHICCRDYAAAVMHQDECIALAQGKVPFWRMFATAKAEAYFARSLAVARRQQAKSGKLRAAMSLARFWRDQGKMQQARELLAPVYGWFTEGLAPAI
jgi:predicted ATPase